MSQKSDITDQISILVELINDEVYILNSLDSTMLSKAEKSEFYNDVIDHLSDILETTANQLKKLKN